MRFAVVAMACNEDDVLVRMLKSLPGCEVHVSIDRKTTDRSRQVALEHGAKVCEHDFLDNSWSATRNAVIERVEAVSDADWFFWLDADEWLMCDPALVDACIEQAEINGVEAVSVELHDMPIDSHVTPGVWMNVKIARRGLRYIYRRHEVFPRTTTRVNAPMIVVGHNKSQRAEVIAANEVLKHDLAALLSDHEEFGDERTTFYVADAMFTAGRTEDCIRWCLRGIELEQQQAGLRSMLRDKCAQAYRSQQLHREALTVTLPKLSTGDRSEFGEACFDVGTDYLNLGQLDDAEFFIKQAIHSGNEFKASGIQNPEKTGSMAYYALAVIDFNRGKLLTAAAWLGRAMELGEKPQFQNLWNNIIEAAQPQPEPAPEVTSQDSGG